MAKSQLLHEKRKRSTRKYVRHKRVDPSMPLEVIEMDIKFQWISEHQRYAYILTIIDCFTRRVLKWSSAYSINRNHIIRECEYVIVNYLQPHEMLKKKITIEVRNDNDTRFAAKIVQEFFKENGLDQVFTHPYTPEENGHVESFHSILSKSLERKEPFKTLTDLNEHLEHFYSIYNNIRLHGSLDHLNPDLFWDLWKRGLIHSEPRKNKTRKNKLTIPQYQLSGKGNLREHSACP